MINEWQERLDMWQIVNPTGTENEFIDWMKQFNRQLKEPSIVTLKDHFDKAMVKINRNENQLLEKVAILSSMFAVKMKDDCCRTVTNWIELVNAQHIANRSWDGRFTLDSFGFDKNRVYIIDVPRSQATSSARRNDSRRLSFWLGKILVLDGEKPAYLSHLLQVLENTPRGPLTESMKLGYETHFSLLPSESRIALTYLIKLKMDGLIKEEKQKFIEILGKCSFDRKWLAKLWQIPIFQKIIKGGEEKNMSMYVKEDGYAAFKLLRHYFTHAPDHSRETGMEMLKNNCVLDLTAWKYLGDFAADVVFKLITYNADIKREAKCCQLR
ncbi:uncharacterized protein LOC110430562 [Sorghum bicolor]|nr:uncharacterized protein LOC110430562 [Sorghum bicolor]|eukprot:XP_021304030.1 uncharacterized protein LOC110430562 [Sorghum bicolor]